MYAMYTPDRDRVAPPARGSDLVGVDLALPDHVLQRVEFILVERGTLLCGLGHLRLGRVYVVFVLADDRGAAGSG